MDNFNNENLIQLLEKTAPGQALSTYFRNIEDAERMLRFQDLNDIKSFWTKEEKTKIFNEIKESNDLHIELLSTLSFVKPNSFHQHGSDALQQRIKRATKVLSRFEELK